MPVPFHRLPLLLSALLSLGLAGCAAPGSVAPRASAVLPTTVEAPPEPAACPAGVPAGTRCVSGRDSAGAWYLAAVPPQWNGVLVLHAHGGPELGPPRLQRAVDDLQRWDIVVKAGYAWAGSSFRQGGVTVRPAAEDTERLRRIFVQHVAKPRVTLLHGQSWGASVAAMAASMFMDDGAGRRPYDAVLLTSGVLAGGTRAYDMRLDLRVIYQALCGNHPRPDEPAYPLWMGLPAESTLTAAQLRERVNACLALDRPAAARTPAQQAKVRTLVDVLKIPETAIAGHLAWGTFHFRDIARHRTGGRNVFGNDRVRYRGSADDDGLNASVLRYAADPQAVAAFGADTDPDGRIPVPVLTVHGIGDPTAFVEMQDTWRRTMERAGTGGHLVQAYVDSTEHSYLGDPVYPTLLAALLRWVEQGVPPTPAGIAAACPQFEAAFGPGCRFRPDYRPQPLASRVAPRR